MNELESLRKTNETLLDMLNIAAKQREKYAAIDAENKFLKNQWRLTFAGQAMSAFIASNPSFTDEKSIANMAFRVADEMIKNMVHDD